MLKLFSTQFYYIIVVYRFYRIKYSPFVVQIVYVCKYTFCWISQPESLLQFSDYIFFSPHPKNVCCGFQLYFNQLEFISILTFGNFYNFAHTLPVPTLFHFLDLLRICKNIFILQLSVYRKYLLVFSLKRLFFNQYKFNKCRITIIH